MDKAATWLKKNLAYSFRDPQLLLQALTHRSAPGPNNERLEFLGDSVLQLTISEVVFRDSAGASEGQLSRLRSSLVRDATLAEIAGEIGLGEFLLLGPGEKKTGGHRRASIQADTLEAIFGAVFLDGGLDAAGKVIFKAFGQRLHEMPHAEDLRDPKSRLQEWLQSRRLDLPVYELEKTTGKAHKQTFTVSCRVATVADCTEGQGGTRRDAEQTAAQLMLKQLARKSK